MSAQRSAFVEGWPVLLSVIVVAIPFGIVARQSGLTPAEIMAMSVFVFAGASQFAMVRLFAAGTAWPIVVATVFLINLRHLLMAAALRPHFADVSAARRMAAAFLLTDEAFAMAIGWFRRGRAGGVTWLAVAGGAIGTSLIRAFASRVAPPKALPRGVARYLDALPAAIIAALAGPAVFVPEGALTRGPELAAAVAVVVIV